MALPAARSTINIIVICDLRNQFEATNPHRARLCRGFTSSSCVRLRGSPAIMAARSKATRLCPCSVACKTPNCPQMVCSWEVAQTLLPMKLLCLCVFVWFLIVFIIFESEPTWTFYFVGCVFGRYAVCPSTFRHPAAVDTVTITT